MTVTHSGSIDNSRPVRSPEYYHSVPISRREAILFRADIVVGPVPVSRRDKSSSASN
jgi:hypothetical protein